MPPSCSLPFRLVSEQDKTPGFLACEIIAGYWIFGFSRAKIGTRAKRWPIVWRLAALLSGIALAQLGERCGRAQRMEGTVGFCLFSLLSSSFTLLILDEWPKKRLLPCRLVRNCYLMLCIPSEPTTLSIQTVPREVKVYIRSLLFSLLKLSFLFLTNWPDVLTGASKVLKIRIWLVEFKIWKLYTCESRSCDACRGRHWTFGFDKNVSNDSFTIKL